jgi:hypothetical protein
MVKGEANEVIVSSFVHIVFRKYHDVNRPSISSASIMNLYKKNNIN